MRLCFRCDDLGSAREANEAILACVEAGVARSVGVMACGPELEHAASLSSHMKCEFGLHVCLNAEWDDVKWGPLSDPELVPSWFDEHGHLTQSPQVLHDRGYALAEAVFEVEAQLARLRALGFGVAYMDEHMGVGWLHGLESELRKIALREGLAFRPHSNRLPVEEHEPHWRPAALVKAVLTAPDAEYLWVGHPGYDRGTMKRFKHDGLSDGQVAHDREWDTTALCDPSLREAIEQREAEIIAYSQLGNGR